MVVWRLASRYVGRLDDLGVDAERHVVDEDPPVHLGEVDAPLDRLVEGVERADDVVAVEAEVEGEVVAGAGRDADERARRPPSPREATSACDPSPPAMPITSAPRSIAPRASSSRSSPGSEDHRLDAAPAALLDQGEPLGLPARRTVRFMMRTPCRGRTDRDARDRLRLAAPADHAGARSGRGRWTRRAGRARRPGARPWSSAVSTTATTSPRSTTVATAAAIRIVARAGGRDPRRGRHRPGAARASRASRPTSPTRPTAAITSAAATSTSAPTAAARRAGSGRSTACVESPRHVVLTGSRRRAARRTRRRPRSTVSKKWAGSIVRVSS